MKRMLFLCAALAAAPLAAQGNAPFVIAESGEGFSRLADAVRQVGEYQATILIAPGTYRDCAVQEAGYITYKARQPGTAVFSGGACEGKATLVLRGAGAAVEGLVFQNIRVPDRNGAGIRLERGDLEVSQTTFRNSEQGILSANDANGAISVDRSTFSGLGGCPDGMCSHSIYIGATGSLSVTRSRFERGTGGHYVKCRAPQVEISNNSFDDSNGTSTNYMIDLPAGATGSITGNFFVQGRSKENWSAFISVAPEGSDNPSAGLAISGNEARLAPGVNRQTVFVADWSREPLRLGANTLGPGLKAFERRQR